MSEVIIPDLWPDEIGTNAVRAPIHALKEQATALGKKTKNIVMGAVDTKTAEVEELATGLMHRFYVTAPAINYRRQILDVVHLAEQLYPVFLRSEFLDIPKTEIANEQQLVEQLRRIFNNPKTITLVQALIAQSS